MQNQMEAKLASMGLKSPALPASPSTQRTFGSSLTSGLNRQSMAGGDPSSPMVSSFLSPDSANNLPTNDSGSSAAAATLAQQRAKLKANAAHRISAPGTLSQQFANTQSWPSSQLGQVVERAPSPNNQTQHQQQQPPVQTRSNSNDSKLSPPLPVPSSARPKSTDFTGVANSFRSPGLGRVQNEENEGVGQNMLSPMIGGNWASMVNTPVNPMFGGNNSNESSSNSGHAMDQAAAKLASWGSGAGSGRMVLDDARKFRRTSAASVNAAVSKNSDDNNSVVYGDDGEPIQQQQQQQLTQRNVSGGSTGFANGLRNGGGASNNNNSWQNQNPRSPALSSTRFGGGGNAGLNDDNGLNSANFASQNQQQQLQQAHAQAQALAMAQMAGGFNMFGLQNGMSSPLMNGGFGMGVNGLQGMNGQFAPGMDGLAQLNQMQQAQLFAAQLAAGGYNPAAAFGMAGLSPAGNGGPRGPSGGSRAGGRTPSNRGGTSANGRSGGGGDKEKEEEVDVSLLNDVPGWLRSLRLHKYTPNFEGVGWKEMVVMDEAKLEQMGVAALGARRKLLKTFEAVRAKMGIADPNAAAGGSGELTAAGGDDAAPDSSEA